MRRAGTVPVMASVTTPAIELRSVSCRYPGAVRVALERVDLRVEQGEFVFLTGGSGSGKSTLLRVCLLEERACAGRVHVLGRDVTEAPRSRRHELRQRVGTIFQDYKLLGDRSVAHNVAFALEVAGHDRDTVGSRVEEALALVGLGDRHNTIASHLSGGEQQRVAVARAIAARPRVLLADEPTGNLDPANSHGIFDLLLTLHHGGTTVVVATHDLHTVRRIGMRTLTLDSGVLVEDHQARTEPR
jgi:cell division transport system ATP-binding protein